MTETADNLALDIATLAARIGTERGGGLVTSVLYDLANAIDAGTPIADIWPGRSDENGAPGVSTGGSHEGDRTDAPGAVEDTLPEGIFGRIELPGRREHTGWIAEETRFGVQVAVVRNWDGRVVAEVVPGPGCQVVHLPTPLKRPDPAIALAIEASIDDDYDYPQAEDPF